MTDAPRKRLLFVDDDPLIVDGLRDLLRRERHRWEMVGVISGQQALEVMEQAPVDLVLTDLRMPGMDGVALLTAVKQRWPDVARLMLSGYGDPALVSSAIPVTHQFIDKPCDGPTLKRAIERVFALQDLLASRDLRAVIGQIDQLPSLPSSYWALNDAIRRPDVTAEKLAGLVEQDPALTARVLQLVNSAYFGLPRRVASVQQAITYVGIERLQALMLTAHVIEPGRCPGLGAADLEAWQAHSVQVATIARAIADAGDVANDAFLAGVVHDIGTLILATSVPDAYAQVQASLAEADRPRSVVEFEVFGTTHAEVGAYLLGLWALPLSIVEAVAHHHTPDRLESENPLLEVLWAANELSHGRDPRPRMADPRVSQRVTTWLERHGGVDALAAAGAPAPQRGTS